MDRADLDDLLDRELKDLPPPRAPHTLLPRVMAAAARHSTIRPVTGWFTWTWPRRAASLAAFALLLVVAYLLGTEPPATMARVAAAAADVATVMRVFRDVLFQPVATYFFALGLLFALTCAAAWAVMEVALGGASQR
jgi:hypothetical protein